MSLYDWLMAPLEKQVLSGMRRGLIGLAYGDVLELGCKTGANFAYYHWGKVNSLVATDLTLDPLIHARAPACTAFQECSAEELPFADGSFDVVVETLVFCSVRNLPQAIREVRRVLRPGGLLLHLDHVLPVSPALAALLRALNLIWPHLTGGCNLTRRVSQQLGAAGFLTAKQGGDRLGIFRWGVAQKPS